MRGLLADIRAKNRGFTAVEILISMLLTGIIATGIIATVYNIYSNNDRSTRNMLVVQSLESASFWLNRDTLMAQSFTATGNFSFTLQWQDSDFNEGNNYQGNVYRVSYSLDDGKLRRSAVINNTAPTQITIANYISDDINQTYYHYDTIQRLLTFTVTANNGSLSETRNYEFNLRSDSFYQ